MLWLQARGMVESAFGPSALGHGACAGIPEPSACTFCVLSCCMRRHSCGVLIAFKKDYNLVVAGLVHKALPPAVIVPAVHRVPCTATIFTSKMSYP